MPKAESMRLFRDAPQPRDVDARNIRDALRALGVGIAEDSPIAATSAMSRQIFHTRDSWGKKTVNMLRAALGFVRLPKNGQKSELAQRLRNTFNPSDNTAGTPPSQQNHIGECIAADKKPRRGILDPAIHDGRRVAGPADEIGANYHIIYDDELEEDDFADDSKDFQAECDAVAAAGLRANSPDYFSTYDVLPDSTPIPDLSGIAGPFKLWAKRPTLVEADASIFDPTQRAVYDRVCEWAADAQKSAQPTDAPQLRLTLLGTAGTGKTHVIKEIIKRAREIFGSDDSVFVAAHTGAAASNVGCGATTLASLFKTMGDLISPLIQGISRNPSRRNLQSADC